MAEDPGARATAAPGRLLVSLLALGAVAALYLCRSLDDNRLTSWQWVFAGAPSRLFAVTAAAVALANLLAALPLPGRRPGAILFLASFGAGACFWGEPEVIVDASRYFVQAKYLALHGPGRFLREWGRDVWAWTDLPLVPFLYGLAFRFLGESRNAVQVLTTLFFAGTAVVAERLGRALWDEELGFAAGALLLAIPYLFTQVPLMLVDVPAMFFLSLALLAGVRALQRGGAFRIGLASLAAFLAFFSKYSAWLLLSALPVAWLVLARRGAPRPLRTGGAFALVSAALAAAAMLPRRGFYGEQIALLLDYQAPGLQRWGESLASTFLYQVHPFLTAAALLSAALAIRRRDARYLVAAWPVLILAALRVHRIRYWIPAFPMLALMGACGLQVLPRQIRRLALACAVAPSLAIALFGYLPFLRSTSSVNLKEAGEYLDSLEEESAEILTPPPVDPEVNPAVSVPILDLFTRKRLVYRGDGPLLPPPNVKESPLRFTWEYRSPAYYAAAGAEAGAAVAVVADDLMRPLPEGAERRIRGLRLARTFAASEGVFRHRTLVAVYRAAPPGPP